jgi:acyl-CoA thioesterase I
MTTFLVQHITGGDAFFTGLVLLLVAVVLARLARWRRSRGVTLFVIIAVLLIAVSATPLPWWLYGVFALTVAAWCALLAGRKTSQLVSPSGGEVETSAPPAADAPGHRPLLLAGLLIFTIIIVAVWELRWRSTPRVPIEADGRLIILADSVTAGIGEREAVRWPELLRERHPSLVIDDRSKMGATVGSVLELIEEQPLDDGVVLIEIGGNDLLGSTSLDDFERDLNQLLKTASAGGRPVLMFELPLPPGYNGWGLAQRRLANRYGVSVVPKRRFASILLSGEMTLDSIHLNQAGHQAMARLVEEMCGLTAGPR